VGIAVLLGWELVPGSEILHEVFPAMVLSTVTFWLVSLGTKDGADARVIALMDEADGLRGTGPAATPS